MHKHDSTPCFKDKRRRKRRKNGNNPSQNMIMWEVKGKALVICILMKGGKSKSR